MTRSIIRMCRAAMMASLAWGAVTQAGFLDQLGQNLKNMAGGAAHGTQGGTVLAAAPANPIAGEQEQQRFSRVVYKGYAREFLPVKQLIYEGKIKEAVAFYANGDKTRLPAVKAQFTEQIEEDESSTADTPNPEDDGLRFLTLLELGTLELDSGATTDSIAHLQEAQARIEQQQDEGVVTRVIKEGHHSFEWVESSISHLMGI